MSWQPIETAPRSGERLLLWDGFTVFEGFWNGMWQTAEHMQGRPWASHWMPLPEPPEPRSVAAVEGVEE